MEKKFELKDSGKREEFKSGAVRDTREGKGRFDLISPFFLKRLADVMEKGAVKYTARNWEKGMEFSRLLDSALRHINQFIQGLQDEDHLAQASFNLMAVIHFQDTKRKALNDLPDYQQMIAHTHAVDLDELPNPGEIVYVAKKMELDFSKKK